MTSLSKTFHGRWIWLWKSLNWIKQLLLRLSLILFLFLQSSIPSQNKYISTSPLSQLLPCIYNEVPASYTTHPRTSSNIVEYNKFRTSTSSSAYKKDSQRWIAQRRWTHRWFPFFHLVDCLTRLVFVWCMDIEIRWIRGGGRCLVSSIRSCAISLIPYNY